MGINNSHNSNNKKGSKHSNNMNLIHLGKNSSYYSSKD